MNYQISISAQGANLKKNKINKLLLKEKFQTILNQFRRFLKKTPATIKTICRKTFQKTVFLENHDSQILYKEFVHVTKLTFITINNIIIFLYDLDNRLEKI